MISAWTKHCKTEEEKKQFENSVLGSRHVLERLAELMKEDMDSLARMEVSSKVYESPNWAFKQAHANGYVSCLNAYMKLINLDPKETNERDSVRPEQPTVSRPS